MSRRGCLPTSAEGGWLTTRSWMRVHPTRNRKVDGLNSRDARPEAQVIPKVHALQHPCPQNPRSDPDASGPAEAVPNETRMRLD